MRWPWKKESDLVHRTCGACGVLIFHAVDERGNIVPLNSEAEVRYLVPEQQVVRGPARRPHAMELRTYTSHIQTCTRRKAVKRFEGNWRE